MTQFQNWRSIYLFGDPLQLEPFNLAGGFNEFREFGKMSPLGLLRDKGYPLLWLDTQYRMHPTLAKHPAQYFYEGKLKSDVSTQEDNPEREAMRLITSERCHLPVPSPYVVVDVVNGISRAQEHGTSSENYANAESISQFVDWLFLTGVAVEKITILTYYTGQKRLIRSKLREMCLNNGRDWDVDGIAIETADSFQGQENSIILLDLVTAKPIRDTAQQGMESRLDPNDDDDDDAEAPEDDSEHVITKGPALTHHMTDPHRLCCSLTRPRDGLIVFCKSTTILASGGRRGHSKAAQALVAMITDAHERKVLFKDSTSLDTSPQGLAMAQKWNSAKVDEFRRRADQLRMSYLNKALPQHLEPQPVHRQARRVWRTPQGPRYHASQVPHLDPSVDPETIRNDPAQVPFAIVGPKQRKSKWVSMEIDDDATEKEKGKGKAGTVFPGEPTELPNFQRQRADN